MAPFVCGDDPEHYTELIFPQAAAKSPCTNVVSGKDYPATGPGAATWFNYSGCGQWKEYGVTPHEDVFIHAWGDSCPGCVLYHVGFEILEDFGDGWEVVETHDPPDSKGMVFDTFYTPQTEAFRIDTISDSQGFYVHVRACSPSGDSD